MKKGKKGPRITSLDLLQNLAQTQPKKEKNNQIIEVESEHDYDEEEE